MPEPAPDKKLQLPVTFATIYGPYAFGVASLLIIWFSIVKPELDHRAIDFQSQMDILRTLGERDRQQESIARSMQETAQTMAATAAVLERTVARLEDARGN